MQGLLNPIKSPKQHILPLLLIAVLSLFLNVRHLNEPPAYIHAWAQADNYSLALGFLHNGGDLFHPQTMIYNKQQKGYDDPVSLVTACDLPLHHWIASLLMRITGSHSPWVFRGLTLIISILGLWALYGLAFLLTCSRTKALLTAMVMATSPSFAYYSASFLPTVPALSLAVGGLLFYVLHLRDGKTIYLYVSIFLLTLSMMMRMSFAVLWVAVACFQLLRILRHETKLSSSWLPFVAGVFLFAAWWIWSMHLRQEYGSLFLSSLLPVKDSTQAHEIFQNVHDRWRFHYFLRMHHWLYVVVAVGAIVCLVIKKKESSPADKKLSLWWLLVIWIFGEILFAIAMMQQYCDHDYYFLDSFFLPIILLLAGLLALIPNPNKRWGKVTTLAVALVLIGFMTSGAWRMQQERRLEGVESLKTAIRYKEANKMLEEAGYASQDLRFLTLFSYPQNTPFVMMNREGYAVMWTNPKIVAHALTFDYDYILVEDEVYRNEFENAPYILPYLRRLAGNGELSLCERSDTVLHSTPEHFFE